MVLGLLTYALRDLVAFVLSGFLRFLWFLDSLPQALVWSVLLLVLLFLTLRLGGKGKPSTVAQEPRVKDARSELVELTELIRECEASPHARRVLAQRLAQAAVALRLHREPIVARQAWEELEEGRWPPSPDLREMLRPGRPGSPRGYRRRLAQAVDELWMYAQGGKFDR